MTPAEIVLAERRARYEIGKKLYRPNGGPFVTDHPDGLVGEMLDEGYDLLNYSDPLRPWRCRIARALVWCAAWLLVRQRDRERREKHNGNV